MSSDSEDIPIPNLSENYTEDQIIVQNLEPEDESPRDLPVDLDSKKPNLNRFKSQNYSVVPSMVEKCDDHTETDSYIQKRVR